MRHNSGGCSRTTYQYVLKYKDRSGIGVNTPSVLTLTDRVVRWIHTCNDFEVRVRSGGGACLPGWMKLCVLRFDIAPLRCEVARWFCSGYRRRLHYPPPTTTTTTTTTIITSITNSTNTATTTTNTTSIQYYQYHHNHHYPNHLLNRHHHGPMCFVCVVLVRWPYRRGFVRGS